MASPFGACLRPGRGDIRPAPRSLRVIRQMSVGNYNSKETIVAQYRAVIKGTRGEASRLGHKKSGIWADINAWNIGVRVCGRFDAARGDEFTVYLTGGSNRKCESKLIGVFSRVDVMPAESRVVVDRL